MEQTFCLDSFNRDSTVYVEPNNFVLDLKGRYEVQFATLASIELPLTQYTIEQEWCGFEFDVGVSLFERPCRTATVITAPGEAPQTQVVLPLPVTQLVGLGGNLWETADGTAHGIFEGTLTVPDFHASVILPAEVDSPSPITGVPALNQVRGPPNTFGDYAALMVHSAGVRAFTGPQQLAAVLNVAFSHFDWPAQFSYDTVKNSATLTALQGFVLADTPNAVLPRSLGFMCRAGIGIMHFPAISDSFPAGKRIAAAIPIGNYEATTLRSALEALLNPLATTSVFPMAATFYIEVFEGTGPVAVAVPSMRSYHPRGIALSINTLIAGAGLPNIVFNFENDRYRFDTDDASAPFVVSWGPTTGDQDFASRLGFDPTPTPLSRTALGAPRHYVDIPTALAMPLVYEGESINLTRKFVFSSRPRVQRSPLSPIIATSDGLSLTVPVGSVPLEYLLVIDDSFFAFAERISGNVILLAPLGPVPPAGNYEAFIVPVLNSAFNIYMIIQPRTCYHRLAEIIGLREGLTAWVGTATTSPSALVCPRIWTFDGPAYVLLDLGLQHMSALLTHRCGEDLRVNFVGKILLYPFFKLDRGIPMSKSGTGISVVSQLQVSLLNPWYTPYNFHGKEWSFTVVFGSSTQPARTTCP